MRISMENHGCHSDNDNPINRKHLVLKREFRQLQRQLNAGERHSLYENITSAHSGDNTTFYMIICRQRQSGKRMISFLIVGDYDTPDFIREAWTNYFSDLSTPKEISRKEQYRTQVELDHILFQEVSDNEEEKCIEYEIRNCLSKMKTGKASD
ncbi:unnamed protein product [Mytilus coruscus]|uniref:Uncharacterized protein n=1 Tax=Mytilus coruscus TaxID=42192 RepID=A0A6J8CYV9_MYTCO|nr:unnamed protein product [Mytilus coruscus]